MLCLHDLRGQQSFAQFKHNSPHNLCLTADRRSFFSAHPSTSRCNELEAQLKAPFTTLPWRSPCVHSLSPPERVPESFSPPFSAAKRLLKHLSGTESRIANRKIPRITGQNHQKFSSEKQTIESNHNEVESRKIVSESPTESHPNNA